MKRDPSLIPFSHDHHQGLVFVLRMKKGLDLHIDEATLKRFIFDFWDEHLLSHFEEEERLLIPFMNKDHDLTREFNKDHQDIRGLVKQLRSDEADKTYSIIRKLADRIEKHIRFEERQLFPFLEVHLDQDQLALIGKELESHPDVCHNFRPEFWKKKLGPES